MRFSIVLPFVASVLVVVVIVIFVAINTLNLIDGVEPSFEPVDRIVGYKDSVVVEVKGIALSSPDNVPVESYVKTDEGGSLRLRFTNGGDVQAICTFNGNTEFTNRPDPSQQNLLFLLIRAEEDGTCVDEATFEIGFPEVGTLKTVGTAIRFSLIPGKEAHIAVFEGSATLDLDPRYQDTRVEIAQNKEVSISIRTLAVEPPSEAEFTADEQREFGRIKELLTTEDVAETPIPGSESPTPELPEITLAIEQEGEEVPVFELGIETVVEFTVTVINEKEEPVLGIEWDPENTIPGLTMGPANEDGEYHGEIDISGETVPRKGERLLVAKETREFIDEDGLVTTEEIIAKSFVVFELVHPGPCVLSPDTLSWQALRSGNVLSLIDAQDDRWEKFRVASSFEGIYLFLPGNESLFEIEDESRLNRVGDYLQLNPDDTFRLESNGEVIVGDWCSDNDQIHLIQKQP